MCFSLGDETVGDFHSLPCGVPVVYLGWRFPESDDNCGSLPWAAPRPRPDRQRPLRPSTQPRAARLAAPPWPTPNARKPAAPRAPGPFPWLPARPHQFVPDARGSLDLAAHPRSPVCFNCAQSQCHRSPVTAPIPVSRRTNRGSEGLKMAPRAPLTRHVQQLAAPAVRLLPAWLPPVLGPSPAPPPPAGSDQGCSSLPHCPPGPTPLAEAPPEPPGVTRAPHGAS